MHEVPSLLDIQPNHCEILFLDEKIDQLVAALTNQKSTKNEPCVISIAHSTYSST